jgi:hypothetical protein
MSKVTDNREAAFVRNPKRAVTQNVPVSKFEEAIDIKAVKAEVNADD